MPHIHQLFSNFYFLSIFSVVFAFLLSYRMFPVIIYLSRKKNLMDEPEERSMHHHKTPTLGGIGMFIAFSLAIILFGMFLGLSQPDLIQLLSVVAATMILLFLGVKDDLLVLSPRKKITGQIVAATIVILSADIRLYSFYGVFGIEELSYGFSILFSIFIFVFIINAFNLIDGIDGLAGSVAIIASATFGIFFFMNENYLLLLVSCILIGAIIGFLRYNLSDDNKIFMGDSGSMFIGFLLAYQAFCFLGLNGMETTLHTAVNAPIIVLSILAFPILDTFRVFIIRIRQKRNPFSADRNHIHHRLLDLGLKHKQATVLISFMNIMVIALAFLIKDLYIHVQLFVLIVIVPMICLSPFMMVREKGKLKLVMPKM